MGQAGCESTTYRAAGAHKACNTEVAKDRLTITGNKDVLRLDIAVKNAPFMSGSEGTGDGAPDGGGRVSGKRATLGDKSAEGTSG
jgi:hypothetical protein